MEAFAYARPTSREEALAQLGGSFEESAILAGGTDLLSLMKNYVVTPKRLVDIKGVKEFRGITKGADGVRIGATVTLQELADDAGLQKDFPGLVAAAAAVPSMQIRNMGTVGGDLCQRPRCWYFRNGFGLLAHDAQGKPLVPGGDNRYHAILENGGPAYFVNPSSLAPVLIAVGAELEIAGGKATRKVALEKFYRAPKGEHERECALAANEIVTAVLLPKDAELWRTAIYEVREKQALDWPLATAAVALRLGRGNMFGAESPDAVGKARIVLGHVAPVPWRAAGAEVALAGQKVSAESAAKAGEAAVEGARPLSGNRYKVQLARVAVKRAILAAGRA
ncbi:MAG TPA: FAD binding domain-containing protein [Candidatus Acidoferrales bacterium]|nr:FAD binding domain-containing protein [Candidatus Acidoferrales bacterium]